MLVWFGPVVQSEEGTSVPLLCLWRRDRVATTLGVDSKTGLTLANIGMKHSYGGANIT